MRCPRHTEWPECFVETFTFLLDRSTDAWSEQAMQLTTELYNS